MKPLSLRVRKQTIVDVRGPRQRIYVGGLGVPFTASRVAIRRRNRADCAPSASSTLRPDSASVDAAMRLLRLDEGQTAQPIWEARPALTWASELSSPGGPYPDF